MASTNPVKLIGYHLFNLFVILIGVFFCFFPLATIAYPDKWVGGAYVIGFGVFNFIFVYFFGRSRMVRSYNPSYLLIIDSILVVGFISAIIGFMGMFQAVEWYDTFTHLFVPMIGAFFVYMIYLGYKPKAKFTFGVILVFSLAMIGLIFLWEFLEFFVETYTHHPLWLTNGDPNDFRDDVLAGFIGISLGTIISAYTMKPLLAKLKK
ncbi:hypothetical protein KKC88_00465 [Patescibacteria group bacterium]|nr:hypothetical protein [Patescibacteria group bacterium]MBU1674042.1 hypothetical protein [Patescibacteria group bacterium]MBU1963190.1 hypothetical protein [Patescibacteria group bacterium]